YAPLLTPLAAGFITALLLLMAGYPPSGWRRSGVQAFRHSGVLAFGRSGASSDTPEAPNSLPALLAPALGLLLLAVAYRLYTGYGIALAALGAAVLLPWLAEQEPRAAGRALF